MIRTAADKIIIDGNKLRKCREKAGLLQKELAGKVGLSQCFISQVEKNIYNPGLESLIKIVDALGIKVNDILKK